MENGFERSNTRGSRTSREASAVPQVRNDVGCLQEGPCSGEKSLGVLLHLPAKASLPLLSPMVLTVQSPPCRYVIRFGRRAEDIIWILHAPNSHLFIPSHLGKSQSKRSLLEREEEHWERGCWVWDTGSEEGEIPHQVVLLEPVIYPSLATAQVP